MWERLLKWRRKRRWKIVEMMRRKEVEENKGREGTFGGGIRGQEKMVERA